jgi:hypothetical protein
MSNLGPCLGELWSRVILQLALLTITSCGGIGTILSCLDCEICFLSTIQGFPYYPLFRSKRHHFRAHPLHGVGHKHCFLVGQLERTAFFGRTEQEMKNCHVIRKYLSDESRCRDCLENPSLCPPNYMIPQK